MLKIIEYCLVKDKAVYICGWKIDDIAQLGWIELLKNEKEELTFNFSCNLKEYSKDKLDMFCNNLLKDLKYMPKKENIFYSSSMEAIKKEQNKKTLEAHGIYNIKI